ncbi:MAG: hypothetical protein ABGW50_08095 [Thermococcus sp.]
MSEVGPGYLEELLEMLESLDEEERWLAKELLDDLEEDLFVERNWGW